MRSLIIFVVLVFGIAIGIFHFFSAKNEISLPSNSEISEIETLNQKTKDEVVLKEKIIVQSVELMAPDSVEFIVNSIDVDEELLDWYFSMPVIDPDKTEFSDTDSVLIQFVEKMMEDPEAYLKLSTSGLDNPYLLGALFELPIEYLELLLPYIDRNAEIADIAFERRLYKRFPEAFSDALFDWPNNLGNLPDGLILAAIKNNNKATFGIIQDAAVHSQDPVRIFEALERSEQKKETTFLAAQVWRDFDSSSTRVEQIDIAYIAARYGGSHEAIMELSRIYKTAEGWEEEYLQQLLGFIVASEQVSLTIRFDEVAEDLIYDARLQWWSYPFY